MGNCINSSSSTVVAQKHVNPTGRSGSPCDEQTVESSSLATTTPPPSPLAIAAGLTGMKRDNSVSAELTSSTSTTDGDSSQSAIMAGIITTKKLDDLDDPVSPLSHNHVSSSPSEEVGGNTSTNIEQEREEGQKRLRDLVISGAAVEKIDWKSIIDLAEDLHRREQQLLHTSRKNISRRQALFEKRRRRKEISRRKKLESVGSFSVNLLMYDADMHCQKRESLGSAAIPINANDASTENEKQDAPHDSQEIYVYEDDDPSYALNDGTAQSTSVSRVLFGTERPGTPVSRVLFESERSCTPVSRVLLEAERPSTPVSRVLIESEKPCTPVSRVLLETERPGTPSPFVETRSTHERIAPEGSFLAATSQFNSARDGECSSNSSSSSDSSASSNSSQGNWDLMTIDENATVSDWLS